MRQVRRAKDSRHVFSGQEALLLLYISEQPWQKICGGLLDVQVLHWNPLVCSIQKA